MHTHDEFEPSPFLVENIGLLSKGRALDIAMGSGRNTILPGKNGIRRRGSGYIGRGSQDCHRKSEGIGVTIDARVANLEAADYRIEKNAYDVIICFNYLHRPLISSIKDGLKKGGMAVYQTYTVDQLQFGKPSNPDFLLEHNELLKMFRSFRCLRYHEGIMNKQKALAGIIAQKV
jgi:SAM-dependent methyltransferase